MSKFYMKFLKKHILKKENKISIYTMYETLKNENIINTRQIMFALVFLYESNVIEFKESYICKV